jgi:hypothetical protein
MKSRLIALLIAVAVTASIAAAGATAGQTGRSGGSQPPLPHGTDTFTYDRSLANARTIEQQGSPDAAGHCTFAPTAPLSHALGAPAVAQRQVAMDYDHCVATYQIGNPVDQAATPPANGTSKEVTLPLAQQIARATDDKKPATALPHDSTRTVSSARRAMSSGDNQYSVIWEDPVNIDLSHTTPQIGWSSNGTCVWLSGSGSRPYWWWLSNDGWWLDASDWSTSTYRAGSCTGTNGYYWTTHERATYKNSFFCGWVVTIDVTNAWVTAATAAISGSQDSTSYTTSCAPLHWTGVLS